MKNTVTIQCPWCFEHVEIRLDPQTRGHFVRDCEVCCRPWDMYVIQTKDGALQAQVRRSN